MITLLPSSGNRGGLALRDQLLSQASSRGPRTVQILPEPESVPTRRLPFAYCSAKVVLGWKGATPPCRTMRSSDAKASVNSLLLKPLIVKDLPSAVTV